MWTHLVVTLTFKLAYFRTQPHTHTSKLEQSANSHSNNNKTLFKLIFFYFVLFCFFFVIYCQFSCTSLALITLFNVENEQVLMQKLKKYKSAPNHLDLVMMSTRQCLHFKWMFLSLTIKSEGNSELRNFSYIFSFSHTYLPCENFCAQPLQ